MTRSLEILRPFTAHYRQFEPVTAIPPPHFLGRGHRCLTPHTYTQGEIVNLMIATGSLASTYALRPITYRTLFGLIAATGLRLFEALNLADSDVDLNDNRLTVRKTKFNKSRCLPIQASVVEALTLYRSERRRRFRDDKSARFIVSEIGGRLPKSTAMCL
jgi:integrase/recombinase XerC